MDNLNLSKYAMKQFKKENDLTDIQIDFGGFYYSHHSDIIDHDIEQFVENLLDEDIRDHVSFIKDQVLGGGRNIKGGFNVSF